MAQQLFRPMVWEVGRFQAPRGGGGGKGGSIGGILGDIVGLALAPETGGLSIAIPALAGAGGSLLGSAITGQSVNPLSVIASGAAGGIGGGFGGGMDVLGLGSGVGTGTLGSVATDVGTFGLGGGLGDAAIAGPSFLGADAATGVSLGSGAPGAVAEAVPAGALSGTSSGLAGASPTAVADPFGTAGVAGGAPGVGDSGVFPFSGQGGSSAFSSTFGSGVTEGPATGAASGGAAATPEAWTPGTLTQPGVDPSAWTGGGAVGGSPGLDPAVFPATSAQDFAISGGAGGPLSGTGPNAVGDGFFGNIGQFWRNNRDWLGALTAAGGLGKQLIGGSKTDTSAAEAQRKELLDMLMSQVRQLQSGTLPPEVQQRVQNELQATLARIRSVYGSKGMGNSTAQMEDEAAAQAQAAGSLANASMSQIHSGITASGMGAAQANQIINQALLEDQQLSAAIARLAGAAMMT